MPGLRVNRVSSSLVTLVSLLLTGSLRAALPNIHATYQSDHAWTRGDHLTVSTDRIELDWP